MNLIAVEKLQKVYQGGDEPVFAVHDLSLQVEMGEFTAVIGPSGSGKSTLLSIIGGLTAPSEGKVWVDGIDIYQLSSEQRADFRREYLGFVFQAFHLVPYLNVLENVQIPLAIIPITSREKRERALEMLDRVGLLNKSKRLPSELSGGEQERVAIARALVNRPPIILADEPTGNLDSTTSRDIMNLFCQLNREGQTIIMVTHNTDNLNYVNRCITLRDGKVVKNAPEYQSEQLKA